MSIVVDGILIAPCPIWSMEKRFRDIDVMMKRVCDPRVLSLDRTMDTYSFEMCKKAKLMSVLKS